MNPDLAERLRFVMRGAIIPTNGVTGVTGVTVDYSYASKSPELRQLHGLRVENTKPQSYELKDVTSALPLGELALPDGDYDLAERAAIAADAVPTAYLNAWAYFQVRKPHHVTKEIWRVAINDAGHFLDAWGREAARMKWSDEEIFGQDGLAWFLNGEKVVALKSDLAMTSSQRIFTRHKIQHVSR